MLTDVTRRLNVKSDDLAPLQERAGRALTAPSLPRVCDAPAPPNTAPMSTNTRQATGIEYFLYISTRKRSICLASNSTPVNSAMACACSCRASVSARNAAPTESTAATSLLSRNAARD